MTIRIVLADDHPIVLDGLHQLLAMESDFEVVARCTSGDEAIAAMQRHTPDVVVADLDMPVRNGLDVLRAASASRLNVRVVLLTARISQEHTLEAIRLGVAGIAMKESAPRSIVECIRRVARGEQWLDPAVSHRTLDAVLRRQASLARARAILTARELEVVSMVARGLRNREIAETLSISEGTVKTHLRAIFEKLGVESRMKLSVYAREQMLV